MSGRGEGPHWAAHQAALAAIESPPPNMNGYTPREAWETAMNRVFFAMQKAVQNNADNTARCEICDDRGFDYLGRLCRRCSASPSAEALRFMAETPTDARLAPTDEQLIPIDGSADGAA